MKHVFIIGSKGIPAAYGGYETFVDHLTLQHQTEMNIRYHVACMSDNNLEFKYNGADCFNVAVPNIGPARAIYYDIFALRRCIAYIKKHHIENPIVYILTCRIGPWIGRYSRLIHELGGKYYLNPDGHEWLRAKWSYPVRCYWKISERKMVSKADLIICDSQNIEKYIRTTYRKYLPNTKFIAYGSEVSSVHGMEESLSKWLNQKKISRNGYYLIVGRFVPENNFETMIREFMASNTQRDLVIITTTDGKFFSRLEKRYNFRDDSRIKFVGTVYDQKLLKKIREDAFAYIHGHEVGGTNPSLLEALGSTKLNLLLDVGFNKEVGLSSALYWNKSLGSLKKLIEKVEQFNQSQIDAFGIAAQNRIIASYSWKFIADEYKKVFLG